MLSDHSESTTLQQTRESKYLQYSIPLYESQHTNIHTDTFSEQRKFVSCYNFNFVFNEKNITFSIVIPINTYRLILQMLYCLVQFLSLEEVSMHWQKWKPWTIHKRPSLSITTIPILSWRKEQEWKCSLYNQAYSPSTSLWSRILQRSELTIQKQEWSQRRKIICQNEKQIYLQEVDRLWLQTKRHSSNTMLKNLSFRTLLLHKQRSNLFRQVQYSVIFFKFNWFFRKCNKMKVT